MKALYLVLMMTPFTFGIAGTAHASTFCFNEVAVAAEITLKTQFPPSRVAIYQVSGASLTNGEFMKIYNGLSFNTYKAVGTAVTGDRETAVEIDVDTKAGSCEVLGSTVVIGQTIILK